MPEVTGTVGVSKRTLSRRLIEASAAQLVARNERSLVELTVLVMRCRVTAASLGTKPLAR